MSPSAIVLEVPRYQQPDDATCGPTCLAQVYHYYGKDRQLERLIRDTRQNPEGGTLGVYLGLRALEDGFKVTAFSYNLRVFDPTWFDLDRSSLVEKLSARLAVVESVKLKRTLKAHLEFLNSGGDVRFEELTPTLLTGFLERSQPVITGLSATYLYRTPREYDEEYDDVRGDPAGHFVVVCGYDAATRRFLVTDPSPHAPFSENGRYSVDALRLISSILLGDLTYDAILLVLNPR